MVLLGASRKVKNTILQALFMKKKTLPDKNSQPPFPQNIFMFIVSLIFFGSGKYCVQAIFLLISIHFTNVSPENLVLDRKISPS